MLFFQKTLSIGSFVFPSRKFFSVSSNKGTFFRWLYIRVCFKTWLRLFFQLATQTEVWTGNGISDVNKIGENSSDWKTSTRSWKHRFVFVSFLKAWLKFSFLKIWYTIRLRLLFLFIISGWIEKGTDIVFWRLSFSKAFTLGNDCTPISLSLPL